MSIPKIIHQLWIGPKPAPTKFMNTWRDKHPDFEYMYWNEADLKELYKTQSIGTTLKTGDRISMKLSCIDKIKSIEEINGKADIIRWQILHKYGGVFLDADSICIEPFDEVVMNTKAFAGYENEQVRKGLVATGTMGFPPAHPLCKAAISWIEANPVSQVKTGKMAWQNVGPMLLTNLINTLLYNDITIFPSWYFLPIHCTGVEYTGHGKVYAYQEWGSTKKNYDSMNTIDLPAQFNEPKFSVSVLIPSYNTKHKYVQECLDSIKEQQGHFGIELVWVNDCSSDLCTRLLEKALDSFVKTTRFCRLVYKKMDTNKGVSYCLNQGTVLCTNELVIRHDSDDIMKPQRIVKQLEFLTSHPDCVLLGSNITFFTMSGPKKQFGRDTTHRLRLTWADYCNEKPYAQWIMNHPSLLFKKSAVLAVGNYNLEPSLFEDFELELKILKAYGVLYNIPESLVYYRLHEDQVTHGGKASTPETITRKNAFIESITALKN